MKPPPVPGFIAIGLVAVGSAEGSADGAALATGSTESGVVALGAGVVVVAFGAAAVVVVAGAVVVAVAVAVSACASLGFLARMRNAAAAPPRRRTPMTATMGSGDRFLCAGRATGAVRTLGTAGRAGIAPAMGGGGVA